MADLFNKQDISLQQPMTADFCTITGIGDGESYAINVQVTYQQQITRRRTIGGQSNFAVIYGALPQGQISLSRLAVKGNMNEIGSGPCWDTCTGGTVTISIAGACGETGPTLTCTGCIVTSYSVTMDADSLTVMDNVTIEFLQMSKT